MSKLITHKKGSSLLLAVILLSCIMALPATAQKDSAVVLKTYRVGIFAPLYLDTIFTSTGTIRFTDGLPKFMVPGLDFVHGAEIALDSMKAGKENIDAFIYDTKSYTQAIPQLIKDKKLDQLDAIIGSVKDLEFKQLADFARTKSIPFISATYPNDGGVTANPFLVIVNSTLKSHCEAIFSYLIQNHGTDKIFLCRQKGVQEDKVAAYFKMINGQEGKPLLDIQTLNFDSIVSPGLLKNRLDSNRQTVIIGGSLDEIFATNLTGACYELHETYPIILLGMPNWDNFKALVKKDMYADFPIYFTTPYFNGKWDAYSKIVNSAYTKKYKGKATDMAFKGFECTYLFTKLVTKYPGTVMNHLNEKGFKVFSDYNFRPVMLKKDTQFPDYFENKHVYFIKIMNGTVSKAW
jgi:Periplasmic binding protein